MIRRSIFFIASFSFFLLIHGQKKDTLRLYYPVNVSALGENAPRVDSLSGALKGRVYNIWIYGYADFLHTDAYNESLSLQRAETVKQRLLQNSSEPQMTILACKGKGEKNSADNGSAAGQQEQRRVDVIVEVRPANRVVDTRPTKLAKKDTIHNTRPIDVDELKSKGNLVLEGLSFYPGRHTLMEKSLPTLQSLLTTLLQHPEIRIEIQGHICCWDRPGDGYDYDSDNMHLSTNRAKEVYDYLVENGVEADRLEYKGYGHSRPKVKEVSPETEQTNRRVEIRVIK